MAVAPEMVDFVESAGPAAVAYGPDLKVILDPHRDFWMYFFGSPWKIRELGSMWREVQEPLTQCRGEVSRTLTSLAEGADLLLTGMNYEDTAANVAEHCGIPLATLHIFPWRANGQLLPFLPAPLGRAAMKTLEWLSLRGAKKVEDAQRRELGLPEATSPWTRRIAERGSLEIQAYDESCYPGLAAEWAKWNGQRPFVGALSLELPTDTDDEVASWIAAGKPPICFGFGSVGVESAADTLAMISSACAQLGERALICAAGTDFNNVSHVGAREGGGRDELRGGPSGLPRFRSPRWRGHHERRPARRTPHLDPVDLARSSGVGSSRQTLESGYWTALFGHHREIVARGPSHRPRPSMPHPCPRTRRPDDHVRRKRRGRRRSCGKFRPRQACWLIVDGTRQVLLYERCQMCVIAYRIR